MFAPKIIAIARNQLRLMKKQVKAVWSRYETTNLGSGSKLLKNQNGRLFPVSLFLSSPNDIDLSHSAVMLSLRRIKRLVFTRLASPTIVTCEASRAKTKLFILLRLDMTTE